MTRLTLTHVQRQIVSCELCPRLRTYCQRIARDKRRAFRDETYWARPVPGFGDPDARMLLVGLAPAAHGANRTGRVFTGDGAGGSGDFLMSALHRAGFANIPTSHRCDDGLTLSDAFIASAVRCAPPDNKPTPEEIARCLPHLAAEIAALPRVRPSSPSAASDSTRTCACSGSRARSCGRARRSATGSRIVCRTARCSSAAITRAGRIRIPASSRRA